MSLSDEALRCDAKRTRSRPLALRGWSRPILGLDTGGSVGEDIGEGLVAVKKLLEIVIGGPTALDECLGDLPKRTQAVKS